MGFVVNEGLLVPSVVQCFDSCAFLQFFHVILVLGGNSKVCSCVSVILGAYVVSH